MDRACSWHSGKKAASLRGSPAGSQELSCFMAPPRRQPPAPAEMSGSSCLQTQRGMAASKLCCCTALGGEWGPWGRAISELSPALSVPGAARGVDTLQAQAITVPVAMINPTPKQAPSFIHSSIYPSLHLPLRLFILFFHPLGLRQPHKQTRQFWNSGQWEERIP